MQPLRGVYGASGPGCGVMPIMRDGHSLDAWLVFIDDMPVVDETNGRPVLYRAASSADPVDNVVCITHSQVREKLADKCVASGIPMFEARGQNAVVMDNVDVDEEAVLPPFVTLTSNVRIGRCIRAEPYSYDEHDCIIGDFVTFAPGVKRNGKILIEGHAYVGSGGMVARAYPHARGASAVQHDRSRGFDLC